MSKKSEHKLREVMKKIPDHISIEMMEDFLANEHDGDTIDLSSAER